jgi:hypothetical protein
MANAIDRILLGELLRNADYNTFQRIKVGRLAAAATIVLRTRRRFANFMQIFFLTFFLFVMSANLYTNLGSQGSAHNSTGMLPGMFVLLSIQQLAMVFMVRSSLERLETILYVWLQSTPESEDVDRAELVALLSTISLRL